MVLVYRYLCCVRVCISIGVFVQAQSEVKQLSTECLMLREEGAARTEQLEREGRMKEEQHLKQVESLSAKLKAQEEHIDGRTCDGVSLSNYLCVSLHSALMVELEEAKQTSEGALNQLKDQLTASTSEHIRLKADLEGQLRLFSMPCTYIIATSIQVLFAEA